MNRLTVQEVLQQLEESDDYWAADIYISPPDNNVNTDEDSGNEDNETPNNLNGRQLVAEYFVSKRVHEERIELDEEATFERTRKKKQKN